MNIDLEEGEVKSDEEKSNNRILGIDNSDRINDGLEDEEEEAPKTSKTVTYGRRLKNNKKRGGNKRHYEREDSSTLIVGDDKNDDYDEEVTTPDYDDIYNIDLDDIEVLEDKQPKAAAENNDDDEDEENNPFDKLDPQMIELKIKALKSLFAKNSSSSSSNKRLVKMKSPKTKRNASNRSENETNDRDFYLELGRRNLEKVNMCMLGDFDERLMRGGDNYEMQDMELDLSNRQQSQQQPICSGISPPQPQPSLFSQLNLPGTFESMFQSAPNIPTHSSNYSTTLLQTQLLQDQLLYNYYQKAGLTSIVQSWQSTNNQNNTNLSSLLLPAIFSALPLLIDPNSVATSTSAITPPNNTIDSTMQPQRANMMMRNQRPQQQQLNDFRNYANKKKKNKRLNQNLNLSNRRQMELAIRNKSRAKLMKIRESVNEMMTTTNTGDGVINESGLDVDERFIDLTSDRLDVDYRDLASGVVNKSRKRSMSEEKVVNEQPLRKSRSREEQPKGQQLSSIQKAKSVERSQSVDDKQKQLEKQQHNEKQRREESPSKPSKKEASKEYRRSASKEKSDEEKEREKAEREILELRRKLIENMNQRRLLKKQQEEQEIKQPPSQPQRENDEKKTINSNEKQVSSEAAAKKPESVKPNTAAATNVSTMNEDMSYFKKKLLEHEQVLSKSTSQSQSSSSMNNMNHTGGNKRIDRILIRINPSNDDDDDEDSDDESLSTDEDDEEILMARKKAVLSSKLTTTKTLLQQNIGQFLEQAKRMALMADAQKQNTRLVVGGDNNKPANNQVVKPSATVNNEPTKQMTSPTTLLNSTDITSEKDKDSLIKALRDRINLKSKLIAELAKRSSDLQEFTSRKEKDIDLTKKKITMLREQLQAAEKILAVNERSLSSFKAEKSKIDTKLVSMQYQKKIQQAQLQKVLSISTTTPTSIASNPTTTLVAAKTTATTTFSKQTPPPNTSTSLTKPTVEKTSLTQSEPVPKVTSPNSQQKTTITPPKNQQEVSNASSVTLGEVKESTKTTTTTELVIQLESSPEERKEPQTQQGEKKTLSENKPNQENKQAQVSPPPPLPKEPSPKPPLPPTQQPQQESSIPKPPPTNKPKPAPLNPPLMTPVSTTLGSEVAATAAAVGSQSRITITSRSQSSSSSGSSANTTRPNLFTSKQTDSKLEQIGMQQQNNTVVVEPSRRLNENVVVNAKVVNVSNRKVAPPNKQQQINNNKSNNQHQKPTNQQAEDEAAKESKKAELKHRQRLNECLIEITRDYPHIHANSFDVWSNECIIDSSSTNSCNPSSESNLPISIESKVSSLSINQVLTSSNFTKLVECEEGSSDDTYSPMIYTIENPAEYESPLRCLRGYRFSSNFVAFNQFEEAYSKFYCNSIDFRRPFCPFDLHGSCKDSSCLYQHLNVITMDNFQRTEHFLSYCPQVLGFSSERPTQREAIKKLKAYAKTFMENNLKKMSIKDYFKYLYDHIVENLKIDPPNSTILSRLPILCLNNNKSIGAYDHLEVDIESKSSVPQFAMMPSTTTTRGVADIEAAATNSFTAGLEQLHTMFDLVLSPTNIKRSLEARFYSFLVTRDLDVDWLKRNEQFVESLRRDADVKLPKSFIHDERYFTTKSDLITAWIFHARQELHNTTYSSSESGLERVLNVLSHALESNPRSELIWLLYLKCYVCKRNSLSDYHEICLLCMDNLLTYDLVWLILNTCPVTYIDLPIERYERFLLSCTYQELIVFEQQQENREQNLDDTIVLDDDEDVDANNKQTNRVSYYLFELIVFAVYIKLNSPDTTPTEKTSAVQKQTSTKADEANKSGIESSKAFLTKCLNRTELVNKLEPSDLALLWLCAIHLEAFNHLPSWLMPSELLMSKLSKSLCQASFWSTNISDKRRQFNQRLFVSLNYAYENNTNNMMLANDTGERLMRQYDVFLMPWTASASLLQPAAPKYASSLDKLQNMFYQALRALNIRMPANADSLFALKHRIRMLSLPLYVNLIGLEVANKRYDTAIQICERLLKSADARKIKELWLTIIYIHRCKSQSNQQVTAESTKSNSSDSSLVEETVKTCLNMFPEDAQVTYVAAQFFSSIKKHSTSIELIEEYILRLYFGKSRVLNSSPNMLFRHLLGLVVNPNRDRNILSNADLCKNELDKLDFIYHSRLDQFELKSNILNICLCYCYYMELKGSDEFGFDQVCRTYERLIRNLHIVNQRVVLWIRYFKYLWSNETTQREKEGKKHLLSTEMKTKIKECLEDVKNSSQRTKLNLISPFGYLPPISVESHSVLKRKNDKVANSSFLSTSMKRAKTSPFYYSNRDETTTSDIEHDVADMTLSSSYDYYHNCVADALVRLASQSGSPSSERFALVRLLVELMPTNIDLVKQFVWLSVKVNGLHRTVQLLYDHFCVNSIGDEHLWILCIKLCLDLNDMQQAVLMYHKAVLICSKQFRSTFELKRLAAYLFPSATAKESCIV